MILDFRLRIEDWGLGIYELQVTIYDLEEHFPQRQQRKRRVAKGFLSGFATSLLSLREIEPA
jgi:hypothetical protein